MTVAGRVEARPRGEMRAEDWGGWPGCQNGRGGYWRRRCSPWRQAALAAAGHPWLAAALGVVYLINKALLIAWKQ